MVVKKNELNLLEDLKKYSQKELYDFSNEKSKEQMSSEIKSLYAKYGIDPNKLHNYSELNGLGEILSRSKSQPNEMAKRLFDKKEKKLSSQNEKNDKQAGEDEKPNKHRNFSFSISAIKDYSDAQLKDFFRNKLLTNGWTEEEINRVREKDAKSTYTDNPMSENNFTANTNGLTVLESLVETVKLIIKIKIQGKDKDQVLKDHDDNLKNIVRKWNNKETQNEQLDQGFDYALENDLQGTPDEFEQDSPVQEEPEPDAEPAPDDDALTEEDIELVNQYGIDAKKHSDMVEFLNSEEWQQIQSMMSNTLSKSDSTQ